MAKILPSRMAVIARTRYDPYPSPQITVKVILAGRNGFLRVSLSIRASDAVVWRVVNGAFFRKSVTECIQAELA